MNRREATALLGMLVLSGCGGGGGGGGDGGGGAAAGGGAQAPAAAEASGSSRLRSPPTPHLALWGDSMVPPLARALSLLLPDREIHDGGVIGDTSMQVLERLQAASPDLRDRITIFWFGHNNIRLSGSDALAQVKSDLAAAIASLAPGNDNYVVLAVVNNAISATAGTPEYESVLRLNRDLAAAYPLHFFDIRGFMVDQADPGTPEGASDRGDDVPASPLRADEIHLNGFGAEVLARRIEALLEELGW